jgi:hypothetical protein
VGFCEFGDGDELDLPRWTREDILFLVAQLPARPVEISFFLCVSRVVHLDSLSGFHTTKSFESKRDGDVNVWKQGKKWKELYLHRSMTFFFCVRNSPSEDSILSL